VALAGQSVSLLQATQLPLPSQTLPPLSVQDVPAAAGVAPQQPAVQLTVTHAVVDAVQSVAAVHAWPASTHVVPLVVVESPPASATASEGILLRSKVATSSQPEELAASTLAVIRNAVKKVVCLAMGTLLGTRVGGCGATITHRSQQDLPIVADVPARVRGVDRAETGSAGYLTLRVTAT
jgi:hypothetical protein